MTPWTGLSFLEIIQSDLANKESHKNIIAKTIDLWDVIYILVKMLLKPYIQRSE
jgi:hypothetical protein